MIDGFQRRNSSPTVGLAALLALASCTPRTPSARVCRPVDSAWAVAVHTTDAASGKDVWNVITSAGLSSVAETDSLGWLCIRDLSQAAETLSFTRPGYRDDSTVVHGAPGEVVHHEQRMVRVPRPCCDLRARWQITFQLDSAGALSPRPTARSVAGAVELGPRYLPAEPSDDLDSLVRTVRGLHHVDFTPFFGGPVAKDVSTTIVGGGPDLLHEVMASIPAGDSVEITFIPRMSHGSLSLHGRINGDTVRGLWLQNAYCCGARGRFTMTRVGPADTVDPASTVSRNAGFHRTLRLRPPSATVARGHVPDSRWRPELAVAPGGQLWVASGGLFVADSLTGAWHRVLGGDADPVGADELRIGVHMAFVGPRNTLIGLPERYPMDRAPVLYRTDDGGATWSAVILDGVSAIAAMDAVGPSVWVAVRHHEREQDALLQSADGGKTWREMAVPPSLRDVNLIYRVSTSTAYVATAGRDGTPALWRTADAGAHWSAMRAPSDQGLQRLGESDSRVEQIATIGRWLLVREHGQVFASDESSIHWRPLAGVDAIAAEPGGAQVFVLLDSLRPAFLDSELRVAWRSDRRLALGSYIEEPVYRNGVAYVTEGRGSIHEIRDKTLRVVRP